MDGGRGSLIASLQDPPIRGPLIGRRCVDSLGETSFYPPLAHGLPPPPLTTPNNATGFRGQYATKAGAC